MLIIRRSKLHFTASGMITPIGVILLSNITLFFFHFFIMLGDVSALSVEEQVNPLLLSK